MKPSQANNRNRSLAIVGLIMVLTVVALAGCRSLSAAPTAAPTGGPVASGATPVVAPVTVSATAAPAPAAGTASAPVTAVVPTMAPPTAVAPTAPAALSAHPTYTPPTPVADARLQQTAQRLGDQLKQEQGMVGEPKACAQVWQTKENCVVYLTTAPLIRPEWQQLFPHTDFFFAKNATLVNNPDQYAPLRGSQVIALQDGQRYTAATFPRLLDANHIVITDQNRELVAKAFALMTLAYYLEGDVVFSDAGEIDVQGAFDRFNYGITAWTKLQGLKIRFMFILDAGQLTRVSGNPFEVYTGDFTDVPPDLFPYPVPWPFSYDF